MSGVVSGDWTWSSNLVPGTTASNDQNVAQVISVLCPGAGFGMLHQKCASTLAKVLSTGGAVSNHLWE